MLQKEDNDWIKKCTKYEVEVPGPKVDQRKLGERVRKKDCQPYKLNREDAMDRNKWLNQIRDD